MNRMLRRLAPLSVALLLAAGGWTAARAVRLALAAPAPAPRPPARTPEAMEALYDSGTAAFTGTLAPAAAATVAARAGGGPALLVLLRGGDVVRCEDLGRQLRELRRAAGAGVPLVVWADTAGAAEVGAFLRREKLRDAAVVAGELGRVFARGGTAATPAVLVAGGGGEVRGIAHPRRFTNLRLRSFAVEMQAMLPPGQGGGAGRPGEERTDPE
ncbi:MAG TPA: hypothetical protein VF092_11135 [Longimicrobium sp.]